MDGDTGENGYLNTVSHLGRELKQEGMLVILLRHRWLVVSAVIFSLFIAFLYLLRATPIYTSASRVYVERAGPRIIGDYEGVMTGSNSKSYLYTQAELIKSTPIIGTVADNPQIRQFKTFGGIDNLVGFLKKAIKVSVGRRDDIITVSFDSPYPAEAAQIVNAVVDSYVSYQASRKRSTVSEVLRILQREKVKRDKELSDKFAQLLEFTRSNGLVSVDEGGGHIAFQRLAKLSDALTEAQLATINARADYEAVKSMVKDPDRVKQFAMAQPSPGVRIFVNDEETQLKSQLKEMQVELKSAQSLCTTEHPLIKALRAKIDNIGGELNDTARTFAESYVEVMKQRWITAKQREDELAASFEAQQETARGLAAKAAEYAALKSELRRTEKLCDILDDRIKELNVTEDTGALNISILEVARPADAPSSPQKAKVAMMALLLGLTFGCGLALVREWLDYRLRSAEEVSAILGVPVLGLIPTMSYEQTILTRGQKVVAGCKSLADKLVGLVQAGRSIALGGKAEPPGRSGSKLSSSAGAATLNWAGLKGFAVRLSQKLRFTWQGGISRQESGKTKETRWIPPKADPDTGQLAQRGQKVHLEPKSAVAEAYRTVRTALFFGMPETEAKIILVTSPAPGDGKSTLVSNLGIAMAQAGQKTLILDADFRRPIQHNIFEISGEEGLTNIFAGTHIADEVIRPGPLEGLEVLPAGPEVPNPSEILNSNSFVMGLRTLAQRYDRIIIDSPPVGLVADSQILGAICDVTLLVLRAEKSTRRLALRARDSLVGVGARLVGVVVNDIPQKHGRYGYYGGYGYYGEYYRYGYGREQEKQAKECVAT